MKSLIATTLVVLGLLSAIPAQASEYNDYPGWAERAFTNNYGA